MAEDGGEDGAYVGRRVRGAVQGKDLQCRHFFDDGASALIYAVGMLFVSNER